MSFSSPTARVEDGLYLPENAGVFTRFRVAVRALKVLEKKPDDPIAAPLVNASVDGDLFARFVVQFGGDDEGRALLSDRPSLQGAELDLGALGAMAGGTLGYAFSRYFADNKIHPFESPYALRNDVDYLCKRYRETHDLAHVLTGYGTDALGEMELQAFMRGNLGLRQATLILTFAALLRPHGLPPIWKYTDKLKAAEARGKASANLLLPRYERWWGEPVEAVRARLQIPPLAS